MNKLVACFEMNAHVSDLFGSDLAEKAMWSENEDKEQKRIGRDLTISGGKVTRGKRLDHANDQPPGKCAGQGAETPDDGCGKGLDAQKPRIGVNRTFGGE